MGPGCAFVFESELCKDSVGRSQSQALRRRASHEIKVPSSQWVRRNPLTMALTSRARAVETTFGIGESRNSKFGWEHWRSATLVRHCALTGFSCLLNRRDRASTHRLTHGSFRANAFPALNSAQSSAPRNWSAMRQVKFLLRIHEPLLGMN